MCVCVCVCVYARAHVFVCVRERTERKVRVRVCVCLCVCLRKSVNAFLTFPLSYGFELHVVHGSVYHILMKVSLLSILCLQ